MTSIFSNSCGLVTHLLSSQLCALSTELNDAAAAARCRRDGFGAGVAQIDAQAPDAAADAHGGLPSRGGGGGAPEGRRRHPVRICHHLPMSSCRCRGVDGSGVVVGRFNDTLCHGSAARLNEGERRILCFRAIPALPRKPLPLCKPSFGLSPVCFARPARFLCRIP